MPSLLLALLLACTTPAPNPQTKAAPDARAKAAKVQAMKAAKAKAMRARAAKAKAAKNGGGAGASGKKVGAAGPIVAELRLTPQGEGEMIKTKAQLAMQWEGGQHLAMLGITAGTCTEGEPREVASGIPATWWATCQWKDMTADFAIVNSGGMVLVQRAITKAGETGEWVTVRRVPLADGADLKPGKVVPAAAEGGAPTEAAPAPAPEPPAPAPAPAAPATP